MPKVLSYTPPWLSRPSPGFKLFDSTRKPTISTTQNGFKASNGKQNEEDCRGPQRTIAHRNTEIFTVVNNEIRWSDLTLLKDQSENLDGRETHQRKENARRGQTYRVLGITIFEQIRQLSVSPNGEFLAIATSHTVHVAVLPNPSSFDEGSGISIKVTAFTLGPTTHVLTESSISSILWHPCGVHGSCLVTITREAVVRLWELNKLNRWSFDSPTLAIDLRKLDSATSQEDNVSPRPMGGNRGFSADNIDLEVASACFGGIGSPDESPWSAMTLWTVTTEGDVYALCPLLPSKWQPTSTQIPALSVVAEAQRGLSAPGQSVSKVELAVLDDQWNWLSEVDAEEPFLVPREEGGYVQDPIYSRPSIPGPIPRLQGPFRLSNDSTYDYLDVSDILVVAGKIDREELMQGEDDESEHDLQEAPTGFSAGVIGLITTDGRVHLFLDLDGVEGQWLPSQQPQTVSTRPESHALMLLEAIDTLKPESITDEERPTFSKDPLSRYCFFTTHSQGIYFFSLAPWIDQLDQELLNSSTSGSQSRLMTIRSSMRTLRERIIGFNHSYETDSSTSANACIVLYDSDLGYFLLSSTNENTQPHAVSLDIPRTTMIKTEIPSDNIHDIIPYSEDGEPFTELVTRPAYEPSPVFWNDSSLSSMIAKTVPPHRRRTLHEEIRFSGATLQVMFSTHRLLSEETATIQKAAADLINRCQRMMQEMAEQIQQVRLQASRADQLQRGGGGDDVEGETADEKLGNRVEMARERHEALKERMTNLYRKLLEVEARPLNEKEKEWMRELTQLDMTTDQPTNESVDRKNRDGAMIEPWRHRYEEVKHLGEELVDTAKQAGREGAGKKRGEEDEYAVPNEMRRRKVEQVMGLLERESALVDAVKARLERLNCGI
ncbi:MAG: hypothetical protein Q9170_008191 [Blastenia crenularia]